MNRKMNYEKHAEHALGFEIDFIFPEGLPPGKVDMIQTENSRKTDKVIEHKIKHHWEKNKQPRMFNGDRARYEGKRYDEKSCKLNIFYSHERYMTYFYTADKGLPRSYQADLLSINGVVITKDNLIPVGLRGVETNQAKIWHIVPAGYIDVNLVDAKAKVGMPTLSEAWHSETPYVATERELHEELSLPMESVDTNRMRVVGIIFNYHTNFDTTISVIVPVDCDSSEIALKGSEHETLRFLKVSLSDLKEQLIELSLDLSRNSGHLRGDIALTIAYLYGYSEYCKTLKSVQKEISELS